MGNIISRWITNPFRILFGETRRIQSVPPKKDNISRSPPWPYRLRSRDIAAFSDECDLKVPYDNQRYHTGMILRGHPPPEYVNSEENENLNVVNQPPSPPLAPEPPKPKT